MLITITLVLNVEWWRQLGGGWYVMTLSQAKPAFVEASRCDVSRAYNSMELTYFASNVTK